MFEKFIEEYEPKIQEEELKTNFKTVFKKLKTDEKILNLPELLKKLKIEYSQEFIDCKGKIKYIEPNTFKIIVDKTDPSYIKRFTIAHELGHYFLHNKDLKEKKEFESNYHDSEKLQDMKEVEANKFAAELLILENLAIEEREKYLKKCEKEKIEATQKGLINIVASEFNVSYTFAEFRLKNIGLIN